MDILKEVFAGRQHEQIRVTQNCELSVIDCIKIVNRCQKLHSSSGHAASYFDRLRPFVPDCDNKVHYVQFPGQGQHLTPVASVSAIKEILSIRLRGARFPVKLKEDLCRELQLPITVPNSVYIEEEIIPNLVRCFEHYQPIARYQISPYTVDLYLQSVQLAIECDEHDHINYDRESEFRRTNFIEDKLNCEFVRFDPFDESFNIFDLISSLTHKIMLRTMHGQLAVVDDREYKQEARDLEYRMQLERELTERIKEQELTKRQSIQADIQKHCAEQETKRLRDQEDTKRLQMRTASGGACDVIHLDNLLSAGTAAQSTRSELFAETTDLGNSRLADSAVASSAQPANVTDTFNPIPQYKAARRVAEINPADGQVLHIYDKREEIKKKYKMCLKTLKSKIDSKQVFLGRRWADADFLLPNHEFYDVINEYDRTHLT